MNYLRSSKSLKSYSMQVEEKESTDEHSNLAAKKEKSGLSFARGLKIEVPDSTPNDSSLPINVEDHYKKMIEENPNNALVLRNYAQFLYEVRYICTAFFTSTLMIVQRKEDCELVLTCFDIFLVKEFSFQNCSVKLSCFITLQTKRDVQGAEEFYSRAMLTDPKDGEIIAQYAKVVWEFYHDGDKASSYFERAVQAAPENR